VVARAKNSSMANSSRANSVAGQGEGGRPAPLYLFYGEEDLLIEEELRRLEEAARQSPLPSVERHLGREVIARDLVESACTLPLGGGFRLIVIEEAQAIPAAERAALLPYLDDPCPSTCLAFVYPGKRPAADDKLAAKLKQHALTREFRRLRPGELKDWARGRARSLGLEVEPAALEALVEGSGGALRDLAAEIDKAALGVGQGKRLKVADLAALSRHGSAKPWDVAQLACGGDGAGALLALADLMEANSEAAPLVVLSQLARHIRKVLLAADLKARGASEEEIAQRLRTYPRYLGDYMAAARRGRERLVGMLQSVLAAELDLKTSAAPKRERLEQLILSLAG